MNSSNRQERCRSQDDGEPRRGIDDGDREDLAIKLGSLAMAVLDNMKNNAPTKITIDQREDALDLAELATRARSSVRRNFYSREQEIENVDPPEMPTRFAGQLQQIMRALKILNQYRFSKPELTDNNMKLIAKIALNSVTRSRHIAMVELAKYDTITTAGIAVKLGLRRLRYVDGLKSLLHWKWQIVRRGRVQRETRKIKPAYGRSFNASRTSDMKVPS